MGLHGNALEVDRVGTQYLGGVYWLEVADSAKGTLVTGVVADETVEVVAPCIMGTACPGPDR